MFRTRVSMINREREREREKLKVWSNHRDRLELLVIEFVWVGLVWFIRETTTIVTVPVVFQLNNNIFLCCLCRPNYSCSSFFNFSNKISIFLSLVSHLWTFLFVNTIHPSIHRYEITPKIKIKSNNSLELADWLKNGICFHKQNKNAHHIYAHTT